jgi:hypothetical protein
MLPLAIADMPCRTISGRHRNSLPESLLVLRIVLDATVPHPAAELASALVYQNHKLALWGIARRRLLVERGDQHGEVIGS